MSKRGILKTTVSIPVSVEYVYHCSNMGSRDRLGVPLEPDDPACADIESVKYGGEELPNLPNDVLLTLEEECVEDAETDVTDYRENAQNRTS